MNKKTFWLIFIAFIAILSFSFFLIVNKEKNKVNKTSPVRNVDVDKSSTVNKENDLSENKFDVFKPKDKKIKEQRKRSEPVLEYHSQKDGPLLM